MDQDTSKPDIGQRQYDRAQEIIPGATGLFGFRQEMSVPGQWPAYFKEAKGCEIVDLDGRRFIDLGAFGMGATVLGYADPDVTEAVIRRVRAGSMCNTNPPDEVELAELLLEIHPWAERVRFGRLGGETMAIAMRIARAGTGRDKVAFCGYHGWHDWYLAANLPTDGENPVDRLGDWHLAPGAGPSGVPRALAGSALPFAYNHLDQLESIVRDHGSELAAIVLEPTRNLAPEPGFLEGVRELANRCGARLVFDEITIGWKLCLGGAHLKYGAEPDMAVFAKSLGNGHPMAAIVGRAETMDAFHKSFISSAYWSEAVGPAAALAAVKKMKRIDVPSHLARMGQRYRDGLTSLAEKHNVPLTFTGHPGVFFNVFDHPKAAALQTLWSARMLPKGFLVQGGCYPGYAHQEEHIDACLEASESVFAELAEAIGKDDVESRIGGPIKQAGLRRLA